VTSRNAESETARRRGPLRRPLAHGLDGELEPGFEREQLLGWAISDVHRLLGKSFGRRTRGLGFSTAQWRVLFAIRRRAGLTQTEIADTIDMEKAPVGRLLDRLEAAGLIERRSDPADRRVRRVYMTPEMQKLKPKGLAAGRAMFDDALKGMRPGEVDALIRALARLRTNLADAEGED
jgi:MarR family transcriptional regulator, transcriptional regulator for hemolysin